MPRDDNAHSPDPASFPNTRWTLVGRAGSSDDSHPIAIAEIARLYLPALRAHLLQSLRYDEHRADDLLQGFLATKILQQRLIDGADQTRGRFRTFLLAALDRFVIDEHRHDSAKKRAPREKHDDVDDHRDTLSHKGNGSPADAFDLVWAREVLGEVLATMRHHCEQTHRPQLWEVFDARYLKPATEDVKPESHESLAQRLKLESSHEAANLLVTAKRMFTRLFKSVVSRYAASEAEVRDEVADLWRIFSSASRG